MIAIFKKELRMFFIQMTGYIFLAFSIFLVALFYVAINVFGRMPDFHQVLSASTILFFLMIPTATMRLFADETKSGTDRLIFTSPLSVWQIVFGKYLAASVLFLLAILITILFPFMISRFGELPLAQITGAYVGFTLMGLGFIALGVFISSLTENQIIAAVATFGAIFMFFVLDGLAGAMPADARSGLFFILLIIAGIAGLLYHSIKNWKIPLILFVILGAIALTVFLLEPILFDGLIGRAFRWTSVFSRYDTLTRGALNIEDIVFYISFAGLFIYLTVNSIEKRRWR